ncbi:hypothetical protein, partial [Streptomyces sp. NPDC060205]|uniref:hypothetical protein n=1 Tax=Streptomyces sp. NPDC060205 TaxID=3347072 RepID=UPI003653C7BC
GTLPGRVAVFIQLISLGMKEQLPATAMTSSGGPGTSARIDKHKRGTTERLFTQVSRLNGFIAGGLLQ